MDSFRKITIKVQKSVSQEVFWRDEGGDHGLREKGVQQEGHRELFKW